MKKFTQKWAIIALLEEIRVGYEFDWSVAPLHITLAGVFAIDLPGVQLVNEIKKTLKDEGTFKVRAGKDEFWEDDKKVHVVLIEDSEELQSLFDKFHKHLTKLGAIYNEPQYAGDGHILHSTIQEHSRLKFGEIVKIKRVALIDMLPDGNSYRRRVTSVIRLTEQ